jgi:hypothetical protein
VHGRSPRLAGSIGLLGCLSTCVAVPPAPRAAADVVVEGSIVATRSTGESVPAALVIVRLHNPGDATACVGRYTLRWPGGAFTAAPADLCLAPGDAVERTARVDVAHGDVAALVRAGGPIAVEVASQRGAGST